MLLMMTWMSVLLTKAMAEMGMIMTGVGIVPECSNTIAIPQIIISIIGPDLTKTTPSLDSVEMVTSAVITDREINQLVGTLIDTSTSLTTGGRATGRVIIRLARAIKANITNLHLTTGGLTVLVPHPHLVNRL
jgi:hypothetical protein